MGKYVCTLFSKPMVYLRHNMNTIDLDWLLNLPEPHEYLFFSGDPGRYREVTNPYGRRVYVFWSRYFQQWKVSDAYVPGRDTPVMRVTNYQSYIQTA
jgi:hypothetical protein